MTTYIIYRHGSNAANQSMTPTMVVGSVEAETKEAALKHAEENFTCYNNQRFEIKPASKCSKRDQQEAFESNLANN
jgi:hypothetical protein